MRKVTSEIFPESVKSDSINNTSKSVPLLIGVRIPIVAIFFIMAMKMLVIKVRYNRDIEGLEVEDMELFLETYIHIHLKMLSKVEMYLKSTTLSPNLQFGDV